MPMGPSLSGRGAVPCQSQAAKMGGGGGGRQGTAASEAASATGQAAEVTEQPALASRPRPHNPLWLVVGGLAFG